MANTWVGKLPADMTDDELRDAKTAIADELPAAQERLNVLSAAVGQINREVNDRFRMADNLAPANTLPAYPVDVLAQEFGQ